MASLDLARKFQTRMKVIYSDKHSSLLLFGINYDRKKFCGAGPKIESLVSDQSFQFPSKVQFYKTFYGRNLQLFVIS